MARMLHIRASLALQQCKFTRKLHTLWVMTIDCRNSGNQYRFLAQLQMTGHVRR